MKPHFVVAQALVLFGASYLSLVVSSPTAVAGPTAININLSTGQNASGTVQSTGDAVDAFWNTNGLPAKVVAPGRTDWWGFWPANNTTSVWIAKNPDTNSGNGVGTYSRVFDLAGVN